MIDWNAVMKIASNYIITFAAGWGTGVLAGLDERKSIAFGFVTLGSNALGLHQSKPGIEATGRLDLPR